MLLFNFLFTVPRFTFWAYGSEYPLTFAIVFLAAVIASNLAIQLRRQAEQSAQMAQRSKILLETNQILQKAENYRGNGSSAGKIDGQSNCVL